MKKILLILTLLLLSLYQSAAALQEYNVGQAGKNILLGYNIWQEPRFLSNNSWWPCTVTGKNRTILITTATGAVVDCMATDRSYIGIGATYYETHEIPYSGHRIILSRWYLSSVSNQPCYILIVDDKIIQEKCITTNIGAGVWWYQAYASLNIHNNKLTWNFGSRSTIDLTTGSIISTDTTIPLVWMPWTYYASDADRIQIITYASPRYMLHEYIYIDNTVWWGTYTTYIFEGDIIGWVLSQLDMDEPNRTAVLRSKLYTYVWSDGDRYYVLSQCRTGSVFDTPLPGYNNSWIAYTRAATPGTHEWFFAVPDYPVYHRYVSSWYWLNQVDNWYSALPIIYGANCRQNYAFSNFVGPVPTRVYVYRDNAMYLYVLNEADLAVLSSNSGTGGPAAPGVWSVSYVDQWAACKATENDWTQFLWCLWSFFSYIWDQIIAFFRAIPAWINKMLEIWTTDTRTISFFPTAYAGGWGIAGLLLPDRDPSYGENTIWQIDGMLTGIVFAMIFIITLVVILYITKK